MNWGTTHSTLGAYSLRTYNLGGTLSTLGVPAVCEPTVWEFTIPLYGFSRWGTTHKLEAHKSETYTLLQRILHRHWKLTALGGYSLRAYILTRQIFGAGLALTLASQAIQETLKRKRCFVNHADGVSGTGEPF